MCMDWVGDLFVYFWDRCGNSACFLDDNVGVYGVYFGTKGIFNAKCMLGILHYIFIKSTLCYATWVSTVFFGGVWTGLGLGRKAIR